MGLIGCARIGNHTFIDFVSDLAVEPVAGFLGFYEVTTAQNDCANVRRIAKAALHFNTQRAFAFGGGLGCVGRQDFRRVGAVIIDITRDQNSCAA